MKRSGKKIGYPVQKYDVDDDTDFEEIIEKVSLGQVTSLYIRDFATDAQRLMQGIKTLLDKGIFTSLTIADLDYLTGIELAPAPPNQLKRIYLSTLKISTEKIECIATILQENTTLTQLDLALNQIGDLGVCYIAHALKENTTLTWLNLASNQIRDPGARYIADALKENTTLTWLNLASNYIEDLGAGCIAKALKGNSTLTWLNLESNYIEDLGAGCIASALKENATLMALDLTYNQIEDLGAKYITDALKMNKSLTSLTFGDYTISDEVGGYIVDYLKVNKALLHIDLYSVYIYGEIINQVEALCELNKSYHSGLVKFINHNKNNIISISYKAFDALTLTEEQEQGGFTKIMFCTLLTKISVSYLKTQCELRLVDNFKHLIDASFFKIFGICKEFQNDHPFKNIPEDVMVQITHNLPPVVWKSVITISAQDVVLGLVGDIDAYQVVEAAD